MGREHPRRAVVGVRVDATFALLAREALRLPGLAAEGAALQRLGAEVVAGIFPSNAASWRATAVNAARETRDIL